MAPDCAGSQVAAEGRLMMFDRANGGTELLHVNFAQCREALVAGGFISALQLEADIAALTLRSSRRLRR
jgi:hypothetical protein